jgi:hypothetical protein
LKFKAQCEFTGNCHPEVAQAEVGLEAAEIAGIACCSVDLYSAGRILQPQAIYKQEQERPCAESAVLPTPMIQVIAAPAAAIAPTASVDPIVALLKLKGLLEPGATTQVEFDAKKASQLALV